MAQLESIVEMVAALNTDDDKRDKAIQVIHEDPLSVQVREPWHDIGKNPAPDEFMILLCTGGPAVRIVGDLDRCAEPENPRIEYQDWGAPWTELHSITEEQEKALLTYCQQFYFEA